MAHEAFYYIGAKAAVSNHKGQVLVLHITHPAENRSYWDLPGGRVRDGETVEDALRREVAEETGIEDLKITAPLQMALSGVSLPLPTGRRAGIVFDVYACRTSAITLSLEPHVTATWCSPTRASELLASNPDIPSTITAAVAGLVP